jgi:hypothetical protein
MGATYHNNSPKTPGIEPALSPQCLAGSGQRKEYPNAILAMSFINYIIA